MSDSVGLFTAFWFLIAMCFAMFFGMSIQEDYETARNHNTQEQCEYKHETKCVNAWIKESMQNPKSKGVENE